MDIYEVVTKLVGPINPVGESDVDRQRFQNLKVMTDLVDSLMTDIHSVVHNKDRQEDSMSRSGKYAREFLDHMGIE